MKLGLDEEVHVYKCLKCEYEDNDNWDTCRSCGEDADVSQFVMVYKNKILENKGAYKGATANFNKNGTVSTDNALDKQLKIAGEKVNKFLQANPEVIKWTAIVAAIMVVVFALISIGNGAVTTVSAASPIDTKFECLNKAGYTQAIEASNLDDEQKELLKSYLDTKDKDTNGIVPLKNCGGFGYNGQIVPPTAGYITTDFGVINAAHKTPHSGTDVAAAVGCWAGGEPRGTIQHFIYAVAGGTVTVVKKSTENTFPRFAGKDGYVLIESTPELSIGYMHMHASDILVEPGQVVDAGTPIAWTMGDTGYSKGCHLHQNIFINGQRESLGALMAQAGYSYPISEAEMQEYLANIRTIQGTNDDGTPSGQPFVPKNTTEQTGKTQAKSEIKAQWPSLTPEQLEEENTKLHELWSKTSAWNPLYRNTQANQHGLAGIPLNVLEQMLYDVFYDGTPFPDREHATFAELPQDVKDNLMSLPEMQAKAGVRYIKVYFGSVDAALTYYNTYHYMPATPQNPIK